MKAEIVWKTKKTGGREKPPSGVKNPFYSTLIAFTDTELIWPESVIPWSFFVIKLPEESTEYHWIADVGFVVDHAPHDLLKVNRTFDFFEGKKCVASGRIVSD